MDEEVRAMCALIIWLLAVFENDSYRVFERFVLDVFVSCEKDKWLLV